MLGLDLCFQCKDEGGMLNTQHSNAVFLSGAGSARQETFGSVWRHFGVDVLLVSGGQRAELLLNILQCTGR